MQHIRGFVEALADAMAAEIPHHGEALGFDESLDGVADIAEGGAGFHHRDAAHQRFVGDLHQALGAGAGLARDIHAAGIAVPAVQDHRDVDIQDVAVQQFFAGDAVADDMVDRGADRFRIAAIVERGREWRRGQG